MTADQVLDAWGLDDQQRAQLINQPDPDQIITIHDGLHRIFAGNPGHADAWPIKPNRAFGGRSAIEIMLSGDIKKVRQYVMYHVYNA